jgi:hypothetical protein
MFFWLVMPYCLEKAWHFRGTVTSIFTFEIKSNKESTEAGWKMGNHTWQILLDAG